jgi:hypothetical protein
LAPFPLSTRIWKIENLKQAKEEVNILSSFEFKEIIFRRLDPQGKLKEYLKQVNFTWKYSHEDLLPRELSQQRVLVKYKIPTPEQMIQVDKEVERQKVDIERSKAITKRKMLPRINDQDKDTSSSSVSMYDIDFDDEGTEFVSSQTPSIVRQITPLRINDEEINSSPITEKIPSKRHCFVNSMIIKEEHPSSYNIEEIFGSFTFDLHRREGQAKSRRNNEGFY